MAKEMTDRELLELAAKAAGMYVLPQPWPDVDGWFFCVHHEEPAMHFRKTGSSRNYPDPWMPLTDDGDALRLAVKLKIEPHFLEGGGTDAVMCHNGNEGVLASEMGPDPYAATRSAIVRAAAEFGAAQ